MINDHTLARFGRLDDRLWRPLYDGYSFASIGPTIHYLLTGERLGALLPEDCFGGSYPRVQRIVLILIDSFGWQFWQRYAGCSRIMRRVVDEGVLTPISALFPSTTSASITTLNLGCLPARHAVYEWNMYVPAFGETIQSLAFTPLPQGTAPGLLADRGCDPRAMVLAHETTAHQRLARHGVRSIQLAHAAYAFSPYNRLVSAGAELITHRSLDEALAQLKQLLSEERSRALIHLYWAGLDTVAHLHGPGSDEHERAVLAFWRQLDGELAGLEAPDTLFLLTADHGHVFVDREETIYINERWPQLNGWLAASPTGRTIWPNGCPRDVFLHLRPERRQEALALLAGGLEGVACVLPMERAVKEGLLGAEPIVPELRRRLGDILILPYLDHSVWWREPGVMANPFHGHHGGLAPEELVTVLAAARSL